MAKAELKAALSKKSELSSDVRRNMRVFSTRQAWLAVGLMVASGVVYSIHLWRNLDSSEAYTALAAEQTSYAGVIHTALRFDPGKTPIYQILLHGWIGLFGESEVSLRAPSVILSMINVSLVVVLGAEMFEPGVGLAAAVFWAFSPLAVTFGTWARVYAMLITASLAQFLILWRLRQRATAGGIAVCGILGAVMLYTHLGAALFLGAEAAMLAGSAWRAQRTRPGWLALAISLVLFLPCAPMTFSQIRDHINGHWLDWIGQAHHAGLLRQSIVVLTAGVLCAALSFGPRFEADDREPMRWCAAVSLMPIAALAASSIAIRPMFTIRYVSPSFAVMMLLLARCLAFFGARTLNLSTAAIATVLLGILPYYPWYEPWSDMARIVSSGSSKEPVFFEPNFTNTENPGAAEGFPQGFLRPAFDHYFSGRNPRLVVDPSSTTAARETIARAAIRAGGAWLVTSLGPKEATEELPEACFSVEIKANGADAQLYHIKPLAGCHATAQHPRLAPDCTGLNCPCAGGWQ